MISLDRYSLAVMVEAGFIYLGMQRFKEAKEVFEGARVLAPEDDVPVVAMGNAEFCQGNLLKAVRHYNDALKIKKDSLYAKVYLGEALFFQGKRDEAVKILKDVQKTDARGAAGGFAVALLDAIDQGFVPKMIKEGKKKTHEKKKKTKAGA